jgi:hypothetical protein
MSSDTDIARAMLKHLNTWPFKPCEINLELLERTAVAMKLQPLSGTVITKRYITGTYIGNWPFAVYVRVQKANTAARANAIKWLYDLGQWLSAQANPDIGLKRTAQKVDITSLPSISAINEDGSEEYQAIYTMEYKQTKN